MMRRVLSLLLVAIVAAALFYISRFWDLRLWGRDGLLGIEALRPQGGLLARWLRGTGLQAYELVIWTVGGFLVLSFLERLLSLVSSKSNDIEGQDNDRN